VPSLIGAGLTIGVLLTAGNPDDQAGGQTTIVASTRTQRPVEDQAVRVDVIGRDAIERKMLLSSTGDIAMLLNGLAGLRVQSTSPALGTAIVRIQGLPGRYTRLLADGVTLFGDRPGGYALVRIPPMALGQIEVIKGPASAFYGSDALAGSVNLLSRKPAAEPSREILFSQSARGATDGALWIATPGTSSSHPRTWSSTFLVSAHRQDETDVDADGWPDLPGHERGVVRPHVFWDNGRGRSASGVANVTFEKRRGGSALAREELETKTADGILSGQMTLDSGYIVGGAGMLYVQSRTHDFSDGRDGDRLQTATIEITLRRSTGRHTWLGGVASDWYALRSGGPLLSTYVSTRPGIFFHDDVTVAPWLLVSGSARVDHHNLYGFLLSPRGSALVRGGPWAARFSAGRGYFTPRPLTEETEAAGLARLAIDGTLDVETADSVSVDLTHQTRATVLTFTLFRTTVDHPALVDRTTYTLRTEAEPLETRGVEIVGTARRAPFALTGTYAFVHAREGGDARDLARTPRHNARVIAAAETDRGRVGVEVLFTGAQRLDANPYRSTSEPYTVVSILGEHRVGRLRVFVNAENLTDVRQTRWDPILRPSQDVDGRWAVDAWAPLKGRVIHVGIRVSF
jgi:iron complex outermembrane receptor protein